MKKYNEVRLKVLENMDAIAMITILLLASGIDTTEPTLIIKAMLLPALWLFARIIANSDFF